MGQWSVFTVALLFFYVLIQFTGGEEFDQRIFDQQNLDQETLDQQILDSGFDPPPYETKTINEDPNDGAIVFPSSYYSKSNPSLGPSYSKSYSHAIKTSHLGHSYGGGSYGSKSPFSGSSPYGGGSYTKSKISNYNGGCAGQPPAPMNSGLRCSSYTGCKADCIPSYQFPNGKSQITINCIDGQWKVQDADWDTVPSCQPICLPECQNNGICLAPNQCSCPENFSGPQCQYENKPCLNYPSLPMNSRRTCRSKQCTITCLPGHEFPDGSAIATVVCKNGLWVPTKDKWSSIPDCRATCNPPCLNGGNCLSFNVCQCPQDFRGPQCQYSADVCNPKNLNFNGAYNCSGGMDMFSCSLSCPEGIAFEFPPEILYSCYYSTGKFEPSPVPQCKFPSNVELIPHITNGHKLYQDETGYVGSGSGYHGHGYSHHHFTSSPEDEFLFNEIINGYESHHDKYENKFVTILPKPGSCFAWAGNHYKTFDGKVYSFESKCSHVLLRDGQDSTFSIVVQNSPNCFKNNADSNNCYKIIKLYFQDKQYFLKKSEEGTPIFASTKKILPIPGQLPGIRVSMVGSYIVLSLDSLGVNLKWDGKQLVHVKVKEGLWNRTEGLCGRINGDVKDDMVTKEGLSVKNVVTLASSWKVEDLEDPCDDNPSEEHACNQNGSRQDATKFCKKILSDTRFLACSEMVDITSLLDSCTWDYCSCKESDPTICTCQTLETYVEECLHKGVSQLANWRDENTCPMKCTGGKLYMTCGPKKGQQMCGVTSVPSEECVEGCYCPEGTVLHENECITIDQCPCKLRGKSFSPASTIPKDCNTCTCVKGEWDCTQVSCGARCAAVGDPHYVTFDGKRYDFMGQCSYYLVKGDNFSIEAENVACAGAISLAMNFPVSISSGLPSCTKTVTIRSNEQIIKLKQDHNLVVNGEDITKIPYSIAGIDIRSVSSIFLQVQLPNGIEVWWDGVTRVYVDLPANFKGQTKGLCGTFNNVQKDDFLTPEGDVEQAVIPFANKWKTNEKCNDVPEVLSSHPCDVNLHNKITAEKHCSKLKSDLFKDCHWYVDPEEYYQNCLYDMCSCQFKVSNCLCPTMSAYASECSRKGVKIDWRNEVRECGVHCPGGQKYQVCGNACTRTCSDVSLRPDCKPQCVEGCNCPEGEALDDDGECIPIGQCKCQHEGLDYPAGYKEVRPATKGLELCTCVGGTWQCKLATPQQIKEFPRASDLKAKCDSFNNFEFTTCEDVEPVTCRNMHQNDRFSPTVCHSGCKCKEGYVLDTKNKRCVKPNECPCHHGGRSYKEKSIVQSDCNTCTCTDGKWQCTDRQCTAECSTWGDSHYKTFDGKHFDYQGQCDYVLAKGVLNLDGFDITIQNVPCGSLGTTCSKSVTVRVTVGDDQESLTLSRDKRTPKFIKKKHLTLREKGLFVIVEAPDLGLIVHWDKGTRIYVKVDPRWKDKIKGLCGNYNDNDADDFQTPSGGLPEASANIFGDSWRLQSYCPEALEIGDTCLDRPDRKIWALKKCNIMKSALFAPCHSEVPLDSYFDRCVFDACACDQGGDCECLCTALAAYAQECNNRGAPVKWRSQNLCPLECDEGCSKYSPCISTCPYETCDNLLTNSKLSKSCAEDTCVEGCSPKPCPPDHVYLNSSYTDCVPRNVCKPVCLELDSVTYYEGDLMEEDDCHSCYCSRGEKICKGQPCSTTIPPTFTTHQGEEPLECNPGWTKWINQDKPVTYKTKQQPKLSDIEPLPSEIILNNLKESGRCKVEHMMAIECRTVKTHIPAKETGFNVECSLENGLTCKTSSQSEPCPDFEIRVLCQCDSPTTPTYFFTSSPLCDITRPNQEHPTDCHKFLQCRPSLTGYELVEKTCGDDMMYNPETMICDWPESVKKIKDTCQSSIITSEPPTCPPGMIEDNCAIDCDRLCLHYLFLIRQSGKCREGTKCEKGCVSAEKKLECPPNQFWANEKTCISKYDCMCVNEAGKPVKPGETVYEDICKECQCISNFYTCHDMCKGALELTEPTILKETVKEVESVQATTPYFIAPSVTPPPQCSEDRYINLIQGDQPLPDEAFKSSSVLSSAFAPSHARLDSQVTGTSGGSWSPQYANEDQYLEIDFGRQEPVYGVIIRGSPLYDEYVTSYQVMYSPEGNEFYYVLNEETPPRPQIFRGSIDATSPVKQIFNVPFEAQKIRIKPQTWNNGISLRVEVIGCGESPTTTPIYDFSTIFVPIPAFCDDEMGLRNGSLVDQQISVSSELSPSYGKKNVRLNSASSWQPLTNSPTEWVELDFLEPREITGVVSKGGDAGWVTAYAVKYSQNGKDWNPIMEETIQAERIFLGNFNGNSPQVNNFVLPINARYIKIIPLKWHNSIQMRLEVHGCFKPYPILEIPSTTPVALLPCNHCPGIDAPQLELDACRCVANLWWDGYKCVNRTQCPCMVGHIPYEVGSAFEEEDCSECICKLGGNPYCVPKQCDKCKEGLRSTVTTTCACTCQPCPEGTTLCPTSNICINSTLWCNGVQDCPDDELNCATTQDLATTLPTTTTKKPKVCPIVQCQPGYKKVLRKPSKSQRFHSYLSPMISGQQSFTKNKYKGASYTKTSYGGIKGGVKGGTKGGVKGGNHAGNTRNQLARPQPNTVVVEEQICPEYRCVSEKPPPKFVHTTDECPPIICPANFIPVFDGEVNFKSKSCPSYSCYPPPKPDAVCNITGRTFNTFDDTEYKYDICNHVIGRDLENDEWDVSLKKNCSATCSRDLVIRHQDHVFVIRPDLSIEYDNYEYSVEQMKNIGFQDQGFGLARLGNTILFTSNRYGFWIIWNDLGNVKFGVVHKLEGKVDGLCGYFNDKPEDDKRKPDGTLARTTVEFGDSWALSPEQPTWCEAKACPLHIQNQAWDMCNKVKEQPLSACAKAVDIEAFVSRCLESTCSCLERVSTNRTAEEECRCDAMQSFVVDCLSADSNIDLSDWRMQQDCPASCESPFVYHDCYQRKCEPTCESISDPNVCPKVDKMCFPGCYCPAGYVRKDDTCIKPSSCRDCECNVLPHLQYVTYDESNFTVSGNCVYVMSRDIPNEADGQHKFQVLITNHPCKDKPEKMCVGKVTILYQGHKVHILVDYYRNKLKLIVDSERITDLSEISDWASVRETATKHYKILLIDIQVEVSVYYPSLGVSVKAPSHKYGGKLEGLCGDCDRDPEDDIRKPNGDKPKDINDFSLSWLYENLPGGQTPEECANKPEETCPPLSAEDDPCLQLLDANKFGQCLNVHDPSLFLDWCAKDTCGNHPELSCPAIEAYARDCAASGFCINWRNEFCPPKNCPADQHYEPCARVKQETCDSIKKNGGRKAISNKKSLPIEGCYCPEGKVLLNETCVYPKDCEVCDDEGHHPGDVWKKDKCTTCRCEGTSLKCETQYCPGKETICERGFNAVKVATKEDECCDKYACVPEPTVGPTCETPQKLVCGTDQVLKLDTKPNGCQSFICECKPSDECEKVDLSDDGSLEPGYVKEIDENGCCPVAKLVCHKDTCPAPKECPQYHTLKTETTDGKCCPIYTCEPPKDKCIFETGYTAAANGGERHQTRYEKQKLLKAANETWSDGPCRDCKCLLSDIGKYQSTCSQTDCPSVETHEDYAHFELKAVPIFEQCCPKIKRTACKYNGKTYKVGEKWAKGNDPCVTMECIESENGVQKEITVQTCDKVCKQGYEYEEPTKQCCGYCKQVACVVDEVVHKVGDEWHSSDYCTNYFCLNLNGSLQVEAVKVNCPTLSEEDKKDFVYEHYKVEGECCKETKAKACKVGSKVYKVGETWPSPDGDKCKTVTCVQKESGSLVKQESVETCKKECAKGWEYKESETECCGQCVQIACIVEDKLKKPGETWKSEDNCTTYTCESAGGQFLVSSSYETCPLVDCAEEDTYVKGCCKYCNVTVEALTLCTPQPIQLDQTVGMIRVTRSSNGECVNKQPIKGFTECVGTCHSSTFFSIKTGMHESVCTCCQATKYQPLEVELVCDDGYVWTKKVAVPSKCDCIACGREMQVKNVSAKIKAV